MATTKATTLAHTLSGISSDISTAEINRLDGVTGDLQTQLDAKAPTASPTFTGTVAGITKTHVGLGNVDNVADASQTSLGTVTSGTFNGTIGDSATMSNKYWRTARLADSVPISSSGSEINTVSQTDPHWLAGDGDTTNLPYSDTNLIKVVRAGIYLVNFQATFLYGGTSGSRAINADISYGTTTSGVSSVANALDQISSTGSSDDYGSATAVWVGHCATNSYLRFRVQAWDSTQPYVSDSSRYQIILIRPL